MARKPGMERSLGVVLLLFAGGVWAASESAIEAEQEETIEWLESARELPYSAVYSISRSIDSWFGDEPFEQGGKISGRVSVNGLWMRDKGLTANLRFRVNLRLPNLQRKTYLFFGQDNEHELLVDQPDSFSRQQQLLREKRKEDQSFFAGVGYDLRKSLVFRLGVRSGYKPYVQARYNKQWQLSASDLLQFRETLFWTAKESFGATSAFHYEHRFSPQRFFRWDTAATVSRRTDGLDWKSSAGVFRMFGPKRMLGLEVLINGETGSSIDVAEYGVRASWRRVLYKDWMVSTLTAGYFSPREEGTASERERAWAFGIRLEMLF